MTTDINNQVHVIIAAAGIGRRFKKSAQNKTDSLQITPKQYAMIDDKPVLWHSIKAFDEVDVFDITVVLHADDTFWGQHDFTGFKHAIHTSVGGLERHDSVRNGLLSLPPDNNSWIMVHDAARPCISTNEINDLIQTCMFKQQGGLLVKPLNDTIKFSEQGIAVDKTVERDNLYAALTPQMFRRKDLLQALTLFEADSITDESSALEAQGQKPLMIQGQSTNIKVTTFEDLTMAQFILKQQGRI